jgi:hypothetical protein
MLCTGSLCLTAVLIGSLGDTFWLIKIVLFICCPLQARSLSRPHSHARQTRCICNRRCGSDGKQQAGQSAPGTCCGSESSKEAADRSGPGCAGRTRMYSTSSADHCGMQWDAKRIVVDSKAGSDLQRGDGEPQGNGPKLRLVTVPTGQLAATGTQRVVHSWRGALRLIDAIPATAEAAQRLSASSSSKRAISVWPAKRPPNIRLRPSAGLLWLRSPVEVLIRQQLQR